MTNQSTSRDAGQTSGIQRVQLEDIQVVFQRKGDGQPVVFIHGLAEDHSSWSPVIDRLEDGVCAYAVDVRGLGGTTVGQGNGTASQLAGDLLNFLDTVTGPAICVGFSLGGVIVLEASLQRPDLVRRAIVVGTSSKVGRAAVSFFNDRINQAQTDVHAFREALLSDTKAQIVRHHDAAADVASQRVKAVGDGAGYVNAAQAMVRLAEQPLTERLRDIQVPVHIIQGEKDAFCPHKAAEILRDAMPDATYAEIPDTGHLMSVDQPERLALEISKALKQ